MENLIKQYIFTKLTPPKHVNDLLEFVEDNYERGNITLFEYGRLLALLNHYGVGGLEPLEIKPTVNCMLCNRDIL